MTQNQQRAQFRWQWPGLLTGAGLSAFLWAYWTSLAEVAGRWSEDPQYSHGYLVPAFAALYLWLRRGSLRAENLRPSLWGLAAILIGTAVRLLGTYFHFAYLDQISLLPCLAGLALVLGGKEAFRWTWPGIAYLAFMVPLPHTWSMALSVPMQTFATETSTFVLQVLGRPALAEGNVILLNDLELGIVEACSGLRMLVVFFALSTAVAMVMAKPLWERCLLAASAVPIALVSNVARITVTAILYDSFGPELGHAVFHDLMGWLMMPLALGFLGLEVWILRHLLLERIATPLAGQLSLQRVAVHPVALYGAVNTRRATKKAPPPEPIAAVPAK